MGLALEFPEDARAAPWPLRSAAPHTCQRARSTDTQTRHTRPPRPGPCWAEGSQDTLCVCRAPGGGGGREGPRV